MPVDLKVVSPIPRGYTKMRGGPKMGTHATGGWKVQYGNDFGCPRDTRVVSAFDAVIDKVRLHRLNDHEGDPDGRYGAQITVKSTDGRVWAFYTHVYKLNPDIEFEAGEPLPRGVPIGRISYFKGRVDHLHFAIAEKVGTKIRGVDLSGFWSRTANTTDAHTIRFFGDGKTAPRPDPPQAKPQPPASAPALSRISASEALLLQRSIGNRATAGVVGSAAAYPASAVLAARAASIKLAAAAPGEREERELKMTSRGVRLR